MKKLNIVFLLAVLYPLMSSRPSLALTPMAQQKLSEKLKYQRLNLNLRQYKTNAKGTILEQTSRFNFTPDNWFNLDPMLDDEIQGVSSDKVYIEFGYPKTEKPIIVAVIDSGVDVNHEDLQGKIWINEDEIPNNNIDDDNNGYVDDVMGWNFLGSNKGMAQIKSSNTANGLTLVQGDQSLQLKADSLEVTREYSRLIKLKKQREALGQTLTQQEQQLLKKVQKEVQENRTSALDNYNYYLDNLKLYTESEKVLKEEAGLTEINYEEVANLQPTTSKLALAQKNMIELLDRGLSLDFIESELEYYDVLVNYNYNPKSNARQKIVGDNSNDPTERFYGNNDVIGPDAFHGTHVAGIIGANRENAIGINGVAQNTKIMAIRCVPNGDERDKDVANSIRYAVDNGAQIINMSFGKNYSPHKTVVNQAIKYAQEKGVLLVHAAGNSYDNNDEVKSFPNRYLDQKQADNWIEVGASSFKKGSSLATSFSNYGKQSVDIFAPGRDLKSTTPFNQYDLASGTSMASPVVAGVAALTLSFAPDLNAKELRDVIINTTNRFPKLYVYKARLGKVLFSELSIYGGIPNAYEAVKAVYDSDNQQNGQRSNLIGRLFGR